MVIAGLGERLLEHRLTNVPIVGSSRCELGEGSGANGPMRQFGHERLEQLARAGSVTACEVPFGGGDRA